jgi:hypothetical protein
VSNSRRREGWSYLPAYDNITTQFASAKAAPERLAKEDLDHVGPCCYAIQAFLLGKTYASVQSGHLEWTGVPSRGLML